MKGIFENSGLRFQQRQSLGTNLTCENVRNIRYLKTGTAPHPLLFSSATFKTATKKNFFLLSFFLLLSEGAFHHFSKIKSQKEVTKQYVGRNQDFSSYFCLKIEGSGSKPLTNGSGRPKNIRIRNT